MPHEAKYKKCFICKTKEEQLTNFGSLHHTLYRQKSFCKECIHSSDKFPEVMKEYKSFMFPDAEDGDALFGNYDNFIKAARNDFKDTNPFSAFYIGVKDSDGPYTCVICKTITGKGVSSAPFNGDFEFCHECLNTQKFSDMMRKAYPYISQSFTQETLIRDSVNKYLAADPREDSEPPSRRRKTEPPPPPQFKCPRNSGHMAKVGDEATCSICSQVVCFVHLQNKVELSAGAPPVCKKCHTERVKGNKPNEDGHGKGSGVNGGFAVGTSPPPKKKTIKKEQTGPTQQQLWEISQKFKEEKKAKKAPKKGSK